MIVIDGRTAVSNN